MKPKLAYISCIFILLFTLLNACKNKDSFDNDLTVNLDHLKHLYADKTMLNGAEVGIIHIYSEYPDYTYEIETDEGFTCVDDVARAVILLTMMPDQKENPEHLGMIKKLVEFILNMQAENGYFYNFLEQDMTINKTYVTSIPRPDWWSWRAMWALESAREVLINNDEQISRIDTVVEHLVSNIKDEYLLQAYDYDTINGIPVPSWLPHKNAADQAGVLIIALEKYYRRTDDPAILLLIEKLAEGILQMQIGDNNHFPYGAMLSWKNLWHAYGNIQSYALLRTAKLLNIEKFKESAIQEINFFYSYLYTSFFLDHIWFVFDGQDYLVESSSQYPQIAYSIRPMVFACLEAYEQTGDIYYFDLAENLASWFAGNNPAEHQMYDGLTGRCYDGIVSENEVNLNSGAESTIEALLTLQAIEIWRPESTEEE